MVRRVIVEAQVHLLLAVGVAQPLLEPRQELAEVEAVGGVVDLAVHVLLERGRDGPEHGRSMLKADKGLVKREELT